MSAQTCPSPPIDLNAILQLTMVKSVLRGEEFDISRILETQITQQLVDQILAQMQVPAEWQDFICTMKNMETVKAALAAMRGETYEPQVDRIIELVITLQLIGQLSGGTAGGASAGSTAGSTTGGTA